MNTSNSTSATLRRIWLENYAAEKKQVGRVDLIKAWGCSAAQASADIQRYLADHPGQLEYDTSKKIYVWRGKNRLMKAPHEILNYLY